MNEVIIEDFLKIIRSKNLVNLISCLVSLANCLVTPLEIIQG